MDKLNEMLIATLALVGGFITKRIFSALEKVIVTKDDLEPLQRTSDTILAHLLSTRIKK